jgi:hypothetical protein
MKTHNPTKSEYIAPSIHTTEIRVEQGFQQSAFEQEEAGKAGSISYCAEENDFDI